MSSRSPDLVEQLLQPGDERPTDAELDATEARLGEAYPPSFRALVAEHGLFSLAPERSEGRPPFVVWPLDEHVTALARAADELECEATAEAVGDQLGIDPEIVGALGRVILIGCEHDEDFVGFDLRTRDVASGEAAFVLQLMDDTEIEYLAEHPGQDGERGFAAFLPGFAKRHRA